LAVALAAALLGCGGRNKVQPTARDIRDANDLGRTVQPGSPAERAVLAQLDKIPPDSPTTVKGTEVVAGAPYHAASGRVCRGVDLKAGAGQVVTRVACTRGQEWFFVPNVFTGPNKD